MKDRSKSENGLLSPQSEARASADNTSGDLHELVFAADSARWQFENEKAVDLYSHALALIIEPGNQDPAIEYDLRSGRADCNLRLGNHNDVMADLQVMLQLAESLDDVTLRIRALNRQADIHNINGDLEAHKSTADTSLELARQAGEQRLVVDSLLTLGVAVYDLGDISKGLEYCQQGHDLALELGNTSGMALALFALGTDLTLPYAWGNLPRRKSITRRLWFSTGSHGGVVNQMVGDGLMAIFGAPFPSEKNCQDAVLAALEMMEMVDLFNLEQSALGKTNIQIGIGIATGEVVAGYTGPHTRATYTCVGDTVNLAARLEAHTKVIGHSILIDDATRSCLDPDIPILEQGSVQLKGKTQELSIYAVPYGKQD